MYDVTKADHAVNFINCLKHTKGKWRGVPFELLSWQDEIIRTLFGTVKENGYRQYNTCYCEIPKKNGKSELAAAIALYMTCGDGEWGAEVYGCASDRQQAFITHPVCHLTVCKCCSCSHIRNTACLYSFPFRLRESKGRYDGVIINSLTSA